MKELAHRRLNAAMSVVAISVAVAICVALSILHNASLRETKRIQRDIGFNLRIIPNETDMQHFYLSGYSEHTFDESAVSKLAANETLAYNHIVATLSKRLEVSPGVDAIVTGIGGPAYPPGQKRPPMIKPIESGKIHVGALIATELNIKVGETMNVAGGQFTVERVSPETGTTDDLRIVTNLADAQRILDSAGRVNEIKAIDCLCLETTENPQAIIRSEVERVLPDAKVMMLTAIADARAKQRRTVEDFVSLAMPLVLLAAGAWVAVLAIANVRQRTAEIGVLRALGYRSAAVAGLFLGKAVLIGLAGAIIGYSLGAAVAVVLGPSVFRMTAHAINPQPILGFYAVLLAPLGAAIASFIPAAIAVAHDPATSLAND